MFGNRVKVDSGLWNRIRKDFQNDDDQVVLEKVFHVYLEGRKAIEENKLLKRELSESKRTIKKNLGEMDVLSKDYKRMSMERNKLKKRNAKLKEEIDSLRGSIRDLKKQRTYKKKEVLIKEDRNAIEALKEKNLEQKQEIWKLRTELEESMSWKDRYDGLKSVIDNWKRDNMAVLVKGVPPMDQQNVDIDILDSKAYFRIKADPEGYRKKKNLNDFLVKEITYNSPDGPVL